MRIVGIIKVEGKVESYWVKIGTKFKEIDYRTMMTKTRFA